MYLSTEEGIGRGVSPWLGPNDADNDKRLEDGYGNAWAWPFQPVYIYLYICARKIGATELAAERLVNFRSVYMTFGQRTWSPSKLTNM